MHTLVIVFIIFICIIIINLILNLILKINNDYQIHENMFYGDGEIHWLDEPMTIKVKNSLLLYINTSLKSIVVKDPSILTVFKNCINNTAARGPIQSNNTAARGPIQSNNTRDRKLDLVQLRKKLLKTKLGNSNAGRNEKWRSASRTKNLEWILDNLPNGKKQVITGPYLDIGCGDGSITESVYNNLIDKNDSPTNDMQVYCLEHGDEKPGFSKIVNRETDIKKLKSNYFNTISALMSFHHIPTIETIMEEIGRISKPGSIFILREHDFTYCMSNFESKRDARQFLDWVHVIYYLAESDNSTESVDWLYDMPRTDIVYQYQPISYWDGLLKKIGFERITKRGTKKSLICSYYAAYKKH